MQVKSSKKSSWLITYRASGPTITPEMLRTDCKIHVDEIYTTKERVHKYALIHLKKQLREKTISKALSILYDKYHIMLGDIMAYDSIFGEGSTEEEKMSHHIAFKTLERDMMNMSPDFSSWKEDPSKLGILMRRSKKIPKTMRDARHITKQDLMDTVAKLETSLSEAREHISTVNRLYRTELKQRQELEQELTKYKKE